MKDKNYKVIDFSCKGNVVRFYLGNMEDEDYWGDDWDDSPYEHNAGPVYDKYIKGYADVSFPYDWNIAEPCDGEINSPWSKERMKNRKVPCMVATSLREGEYGWECTTFVEIMAREESVSIYFNDSLSKLLDLEKTKGVKVDVNVL